MTGARRWVCRHIWELWLATGIFLELRGYDRGCHPTFSRKADGWTPHERCRWAPLSWPLLGAWFAWHLIRLKDLPVKETLCSVEPSGCPLSNVP